MEKQIRFKCRIVLDTETKSIDVFDVDSKAIKELSKIGRYDSKDRTQWVKSGNVTYFGVDLK